MYFRHVYTNQVNNLDIVKCIRCFDAGNNNVYMVDGNRYIGKVLRRESIPRIMQGKPIQMIEWPFIDQVDANMLSKVAKAFFDNNSQYDEVPILFDGKIVKVLFKRNPDEFVYKWDEWPGIINEVPASLFKFDNIYLSSLENTNLYEFYKRWSPHLSMKILNKDNIDDLLRQENSLLIYGVDVFPEEIKKISIKEVNQLFVDNGICIDSNCVYFSNDWASIRESELSNLGLIVQLFDKGYQAIAVIDDNGNLIGEIERNEFKNFFPMRQYKISDDIWIQYSSDVAEMKKKLSRFLQGKACDEAFVVSNNKVVKVGVKGVCSGVTGRKDIRKIQPIYWELISDEVAKEFFNGRTRILISSTNGSLDGFFERFNDMITITVFDEKLLPEYFNGRFDLLVFSGDIWRVGPIPRYPADELFTALLIETIMRYLTRRNVKFYWLDFSVNREAADIRYRIIPGVKALNTHSWSDEIGGKWGDTFSYKDVHYGEEFNIFCGRRRTLNIPNEYKHSIFILGYCPAPSLWSDDSETIASYLQGKINIDYPSCYRVVNCGGESAVFSTVNDLYKLMDMYISEGDIILYMSANRAWDRIGLPEPQEYHHVNVHSFFKNRGRAYFIDRSWGHVTAEGNKVFAEYIYTLIKSYVAFQKQDEKGHRVIFPERPYRGIDNVDMNNYLIQLNRYKIDCNNSGAVVMNCNPFTLGHYYLIDTARKQCEHLFVFIVEEDLSEFSFNDRFNMAKLNCQDMANVSVVPSGRYIISSRTFPEYFSKDALKGYVVNPANDVRIFGQYIAAKLNISMRFVGEEPMDDITRQYNLVMREILPEYGIDLIEIPRLNDNKDVPVNATKVRKLLQEGRREDCRSFLTNKTYSYISENWDRIHIRMLEHSSFIC